MEPAGSQETSSTKPAKGSVRRKGGFMGRLIIVLLLCGVLGAGGYFMGWPLALEQWHRLTGLEQQVEKLTVTVEQSPDIAAVASAASDARVRSLLETAQSDWELKLKRLSDEIDAALSDTQNQSSQRIERLEQQVDRLMVTDRRAWSGHEAAFLLRLASQRLLIARDIDAAMALLAQADTLLQATDSPGYEPVRRAIAQDKASLAAVTKVDEVGLYARLAALIDQVARLQLTYEPQATASPDPKPVDQKIAGQNWLDGVESGWYEAMRQLSAYLVIRRSNEDIAALMTPEWAALAQQNLRMLLEQSQIAMLSANAALYQQSLARSADFTALFSQYDPDRIQSILGEIQALQDYDIAPQLPDMLATRNLLDLELERLDTQVAPE
jgi:uncharacterized protein HemX